MPPRSQLRILISGDMEGIYGVYCPEMVSLAKQDEALYAQGRRFYTDELNAAIDGVFTGVNKCFATERMHDVEGHMGDVDVIVADGHAKSTNILHDVLDKRAHVAEREEEVMMLSGITTESSSHQTLDGFACADMVLFVGYHGMARFDLGCNQNTALNPDDVEKQRPSNFLAHTSSGLWIRQVRVNGELVSEGTMNALLAQYFGTKTVFVSGTDEGVAEIQQKIPGIHGVVCIKSRSWSEGASVLLDGTERQPEALPSTGTNSSTTEQIKCDARHYQEMRDAVARAVEAELLSDEDVPWILPGGKLAAERLPVTLRVELKRAVAAPESNDELQQVLEELEAAGCPKRFLSESLDSFEVAADNIYDAHCTYRAILAFLRGRPIPAEGSSTHFGV